MSIPKNKQKSYEELKEQIDSMSRIDMCRTFRFAEPGCSFFDSTNPISEYFERKFREIGGFTPEISKALGWSKK